MRFNTFAASKDELHRCVHAPNLSEVLLEPTSLARQGTLSDRETQSLAITAQELNLEPVLVWDILMPEEVMQQVVTQLRQWDLSLFAAIRVCDPGAALWVIQELPTMPLQWIVEAGNHNLEALRGWCECFAPSLSRLILSIELPEAKLVEYCKALPVPCEILGAGQIVLFYSPRSLLLPHFDQTLAENEPALHTHIISEEMPNRLFPTVETRHGTFMFLDKDQFILDRLDSLQAAGCHTVRIDLRHFVQAGGVVTDIEQICQAALSDAVKLRSQWPRETRAPFFNANRTTNFFPRLRSKLTGQRKETCLAESIAGEGQQYVVFQSLRSFAVTDIQRIQLPTGETLELRANLQVRSPEGQVLKEVESQQVFVTDWIKKVSTGSLLMSGSSLED